MAHVIFLHGASSSGKSTVARALQRRIEKPFWHISIDHLRDAGVLPTERFKRGDFRWADSRMAFFSGFHGSLKAYADAGNDLILDIFSIPRGGWKNLSVSWRGTMSSSPPCIVRSKFWSRVKPREVTDRWAAPRRISRRYMSANGMT
ncbi:phosphotransferase-like protein [Agrobacterium bohemicum]|uniref:phosphotransferase-like protein n=1 Tax=Agrobacterium bohemicum TaxID=2052828 RepID=UPI003CC992EE